MKNRSTKLLPLFLVLCSFFTACDKKEEPAPVPPPLTRQFQLQYGGLNDDGKTSFATLDQSKVPFVYDWATAKNNAAVVHFGLANFINPGLVSPESDIAPALFAHPQNGVATWDQNVLAGIIFDNVDANIDFDNLTIKDIVEGVPDAGFGNDEVNEKFFTSPGKIIRFVQKDVLNATRYKGYLKIGDINNGPVISVTVYAKYVSK